MHKWINIHGLLSEFKIVVLGRFDLDIKQLIRSNPVLRKHKSQFLAFPEFKMNISSTNFRETFDRRVVPASVFEYIIEHELYRGEDDV